MTREIKIIAVPTKYGCFVEGSDKSFASLQDILPYETSLINTIYDNDTIYNNDRIHYLYPVMDIANNLRCECINSYENFFPLILGGDHSASIGSISAALDKHDGDVSLIYIDAHTDIHNDETTPSGNIHGMPLSILIGRCKNKNLSIGIHKLNPHNIFYVGIRSYEKEEIDYIKKNNITFYTDDEVNQKGIVNILKEIKNNIKTKYIHVSLDLDVMKNDEFYAVNVNINKNYSIEGGILFNDLLNGIDYIKKTIKPISMDIVEYNPTLDKDNNCKEKIDKIMKRLN